MKLAYGGILADARMMAGVVCKCSALLDCICGVLDPYFLQHFVRLVISTIEDREGELTYVISIQFEDARVDGLQPDQTVPDRDDMDIPIFWNIDFHIEPTSLAFLKVLCQVKELTDF